MYCKLHLNLSLPHESVRLRRIHRAFLTVVLPWHLGKLVMNFLVPSRSVALFCTHYTAMAVSVSRRREKLKTFFPFVRVRCHLILPVMHIMSPGRLMRGLVIKFGLPVLFADCSATLQ